MKRAEPGVPKVCARCKVAKPWSAFYLVSRGTPYSYCIECERARGDRRRDGCTRRPRGTLEDRFWSKVNKSGPVPPHRPELGECWLWTGNKMGAGYGAIWSPAHRYNIGAHRAAWAVTRGEPGPLNVLHHCDNPPCVNPDHLFLGTHMGNAADMMRKGRGRQGHSVGEDCAHSKLTERAVREIREMGEDAATRRGARQFGVDRRTVRDVLARRTWRHVC